MKTIAFTYKRAFHIALVALIIVTISCNNDKKRARQFLNTAKIAYQEGNYERAKSHIDSIKLIYPKAFDEINEGFSLLQDIRRSENERNIAFIDSMLEVKYQEFKEAQKNFDFVRDEDYQEFGNYIPKITPPSQTIDENTLRSGVNEKGVLFLESLFSSTNLNHHKIKVTIPDGTYAETKDVTADGLNYTFKTRKKSYEIVRYIGSDENGVAKFIYTFEEQPIKISYIGKRTYSKTLSSVEKKAISQSFELSSILLEIENLRFEKGKAESLLRYLDEKAIEDKNIINQ